MPGVSSTSASAARNAWVTSRSVVPGLSLSNTMCWTTAPPSWGGSDTTARYRRCLVLALHKSAPRLCAHTRGQVFLCRTTTQCGKERLDPPLRLGGRRLQHRGAEPAAGEQGELDLEPVGRDGPAAHLLGLLDPVVDGVGVHDEPGRGRRVAAGAEIDAH